jgi:hypothetical protein
MNASFGAIGTGLSIGWLWHPNRLTINTIKPNFFKLNALIIKTLSKLTVDLKGSSPIQMSGLKIWHLHPVRMRNFCVAIFDSASRTLGNDACFA